MDSKKGILPEDTFDSYEDVINEKTLSDGHCTINIPAATNSTRGADGVDEDNHLKKLSKSPEKTENSDALELSQKDSQKYINIKNLKEGETYVESIKVKVISLPMFSKRKTERLLFDVTDDSAKIQVVAFGHKAEDMRTIIKVNSEYIFQNFKVRAIKPQFQTGGHKTEIVLEDSTSINKVDVQI